MSKIDLYHSCPSSCSWRVRIALRLKEIDNVNFHYYDLGKGEHHCGEHAKINPMETVPTMVISGEVNITMTESLPILEYLEEAYPDQGVALLPKDGL